MEILIGLLRDDLAETRKSIALAHGAATDLQGSLSDHALHDEQMLNEIRLSVSSINQSMTGLVGNGKPGKLAEIDAHLEATDARIEAMNANYRSFEKKLLVLGCLGIGYAGANYSMLLKLLGMF